MTRAFFESPYFIRLSAVRTSFFIGNNVWIGGNVIILKGTTIGNNCVIAAGTILANKTIPDNSIVYGKTSLVIKEIQKN